ncbi:MAG TPA: hypothetical protein VE959_02610 [Bryobacteraceae bacterium]|nr:hypothetical protein [Bryobacteraceae bacterium]
MAVALAAMSALALNQRGGAGGGGSGGQLPGAVQDDSARLPSGKLQRDEILKAEHEENLKDAGKLIELAEGLKEDLEKNDRYVLSLSTLKKTDDIEKLVKKIRSRMRHY